MQVADIMHTDVKSADAEDTFADVAKLMRTNGISSVVVLDGQEARRHRDRARHREPRGGRRRPAHA